MARGDIIQAVAYIDATTTQANVPPSQPSTWATPTSGNRLLMAVAGSTALSAGPGGSWVNLLSYSSTYMMEVWTKISDGTENPLNIATMASAAGTQVFAYEIEGDVVVDQQVHNTVASDTAVSSGNTPTLSSNDQLIIAMAHAWASADITFTPGYTLDFNYDGGTNTELYYQGGAHKYQAATTAAAATADWSGGATDFGQVFVVTFDLSTGVTATATALAATSGFGTSTITLSAAPQPAVLYGLVTLPTAVPFADYSVYTYPATIEPVAVTFAQTYPGEPAYISTTNLVDADTAHLHQSAGAWATYNSPTSVALSTDIPSPIPGAANVLKVVFGTTAVGRGAGTTGGIACDASTQYTARIGVYSTKAGVTFQFDANSLDGGLGFLEYHGAAERSHTGTGWEYFTITFTTNASAVYVALYVYRVAGDTSDDTIYVAATSLYAGASATSFIRSLRIVGDLEMEWIGALDDYSAGFYQVLIDCSDGTGLNGYLVAVDPTGVFILSRFGDGSVDRSEGMYPGGSWNTDGVELWYKSTFTKSDGKWRHYLDGSLISTGSAINSNPGSTAITSTLAVTTDNDTTGPAIGKTRVARVRDGIGGVVVASFLATDVKDAV